MQNMRSGVAEVKPNELTVIEHLAAEPDLMQRTKTDEELADSLHRVIQDIRSRGTLVCQ
jgi:hypothetical protein